MLRSAAAILSRSRAVGIPRWAPLRCKFTFERDDGPSKSSSHGPHCGPSCAHSLPRLFQNNKQWSDAMTSKDPEYFQRLVGQQTPEVRGVGLYLVSMVDRS